MTDRGSIPRQIVDLPTDQAAGVLADAFLADEDFQQTFWPQDRMDLARARLFFDMQVVGSEVLRAPALGVAPDGVPEGVITYYTTYRGWNPIGSLRLIKSMWTCYRRVPSSVISRINRYSRWIYANSPKTPHFFITAVGVPPSFRGRGHSAALIAEVLGRSRADPRSRGVAISAFSRTRADLYERHGFRVISHGSPGGIEAWVLYCDHHTSA